jgi:hypothetical protein
MTARRGVQIVQAVQIVETRNSTLRHGEWTARRGVQAVQNVQIVQDVETRDSPRGHGGHGEKSFNHEGAKTAERGR